MNRSADWFQRCLGTGLFRALMFLVLGVALGIFVTLARELGAQGTFPLDDLILQALYTAATPVWDTLMRGITLTGSFLFSLLLMLVLAILWWRRRPYDVVALWVAVVSSTLLNTLIKLIFARPRPDLRPDFYTAIGWSFPSGHSTTALALYGILAYLLGRRLPPVYRSLLYVVTALWIMAVGLSRIYLGVHYPSDVLAAFAITLPLLQAVIVVHRCQERTDGGRWTTDDERQT